MIKCLIYCTKSAPYLRIDQVYDEKLMKINGKYKTSLINSKFNEYEKELIEKHNFFANGKIVAQFDCEKVDIIEVIERKNDKPVYIINGNVNYIGDTCLSYEQLNLYLKNNNGYAIHISNLDIFDEPFDLEKGGIYKEYGYRIKMVTKAPQNMQYVNDIFGREYVLISIRPEWVRKILNGEKTIEVRKSIVNKLKELI